MPAEPIVHEYDLRCPPERAFDTYVDGIAKWWHPAYTQDAKTLEAVTIEPWIGGRVFATHHGAQPDVWGSVTEWDRPHSLAHTFALAQPAEYPSQVRVTFEPTDDGCRFRFAHGGWTDNNRSYRRKYADWPLILDRFAALAESATRQSR